MKNQFLFFKKYSCILVKSEGNTLDTHSDHIYKEYAHYKNKSTCHKHVIHLHLEMRRNCININVYLYIMILGVIYVILFSS